MKRLFIQFPGVTKILAQTPVSDDAIRETEKTIMAGGGSVIPGTGGLRKIRCEAVGRGKSGGVRIVFADYPDAGRCLWLAAFSKTERENLSRGERNELKKLKFQLDHFYHIRAK